MEGLGALSQAAFSRDSFSDVESDHEPPKNIINTSKSSLNNMIPSGKKRSLKSEIREYKALIDYLDEEEEISCSTTAAFIYKLDQKRLKLKSSAYRHSLTWPAHPDNFPANELINGELKRTIIPKQPLVREQPLFWTTFMKPRKVSPETEKLLKAVEESPSFKFDFKKFAAENDIKDSSTLIYTNMALANENEKVEDDLEDREGDHWNEFSVTKMSQSFILHQDLQKLAKIIWDEKWMQRFNDCNEKGREVPPMDSNLSHVLALKSQNLLEALYESLQLLKNQIKELRAVQELEKPSKKRKTSRERGLNWLSVGWAADAIVGVEGLSEAVISRTRIRLAKIFPDTL